MVETDYPLFISDSRPEFQSSTRSQCNAIGHNRKGDRLIGSHRIEIRATLTLSATQNYCRSDQTIQSH